jgi:hypothetical protein
MNSPTEFCFECRSFLWEQLEAADEEIEVKRTSAKRLARRVVGFVLAINLVAVASPAMAARVAPATPPDQAVELDSGSWSSPRIDSGSWSSTQSGSWS